MTLFHKKTLDKQGFVAEEGIRTLDTLLTYTHFPGVRLRPLGHLSNLHRNNEKKSFLRNYYLKKRHFEHFSCLRCNLLHGFAIYLGQVFSQPT